MLNVVSWLRKQKNLTYLPPLMAWKIWLARNRCIFEDKKADINYIVHSLLEELQLCPIHSQLKSKRRDIRLAPAFGFPVGFFDSASTNQMGGIGVYLLIS